RSPTSSTPCSPRPSRARPPTARPPRRGTCSTRPSRRRSPAAPPSSWPPTRCTPPSISGRAASPRGDCQLVASSSWCPVPAGRASVAVDGRAGAGCEIPAGRPRPLVTDRYHRRISTPAEGGPMTGSGTTLDDYTDRYARRVRGMTASEIRALFAVASRPEVVSLAGGAPYVSALPLDAVGEMMRRVAVDHGVHSLQYGIGQGTLELRERICEVMAESGITGEVGASPEDVVVTVGGQQALDLVARLFLDPGDVVLAEGPTYVGALGAFQAAQAEVVHVARDDGGLVPEALEEAIRRVAATGRRAKFLYTIPTYQNPAGVTLTEQRRERVLDICERAGLLVVEDDPYGQLGFSGEAPAP